jgi:hypothetical protein
MRRAAPSWFPPLVTSRARALRRVALAVATLWTVFVPRARRASSLLAMAGMTTPSLDLLMNWGGTTWGGPWWPPWLLAVAQALISLGDPPAVISTLRGLAFSAIGIRRVNTPAS